MKRKWSRSDNLVHMTPLQSKHYQCTLDFLYAQGKLFGRKDCSWDAFDSLFLNVYLPGSWGKSCLLGELCSVTSFFGIQKVICTHLYLCFHHVSLCCKRQFYWQLSAFLILFCRLEILQLSSLWAHLPETEWMERVGGWHLIRAQNPTLIIFWW